MSRGQFVELKDPKQVNVPYKIWVEEAWFDPSTPDYLSCARSILASGWMQKGGLVHGK